MEVAAMTRMRGAEALVRTLEAASAVSVRIPRRGMNILDALTGRSPISSSTRHEQAAASIADGYARVSGTPGICTASVGPGVMNLMVGIGSAAAASSPVVAIGGGVMQRFAGRGQLQESHQSERGAEPTFVPAFAPITKLATQIPANNLVPEVIRHALVVARSGRVPSTSKTHGTCRPNPTSTATRTSCRPHPRRRPGRTGRASSRPRPSSAPVGIR
jgi:acetolactate synthase-1/2/3 large subunit